MGIQLPPELADVAARAGVEWPEADEDRMRASAAAWRDAGGKLTNLSRDADHAARSALGTVQGPAADAARTHWSTFVHPDNGHLTGAARGCNAAADRLEHAADQVGAAKVEIVRNLVDLARNTDAAQQAAGAGHPTALLGLDTSVRGTAANVANITNNLVTAVQPASGVDMSGVRDLVDANPGGPGPDRGHGANPIAAVVDPVATVVAEPVRAVVEPVSTVVAHPGHGGVDGAVPAVVDTVAPGLAHPVRDVVSGVVAPVQDVVSGVASPVQDVASGVVPPGRGVAEVVPGVGHAGPDPVPGAGVLDRGLPSDVTGPGNPELTGPVRIQPDLVLPDAPTPPAGIPLGPGQTVQAGLAGAPAEAAIAPAQTPAAPAAGGPVPTGAPPAGPVPGAPVGGGAPGGIPAAPAAPGPVAGPGAGPPVAGGPVQGPDRQAPAGGTAPAPPDRGRGAFTAAVPPGPPAAAQPAAPTQPTAPVKERRETPAALFWVHMFPIGHIPVVSDEPERQLAPPAPELDYAPGLRFPPGDHPEHHAVAGTQRLEELRAGVPPLHPADGLPAAHPTVQAMAGGYDPLGGQHEREWDRRYLVRLGSVTAQGISSEGKEFAWPPGERYPEGGTAPGDPETLAEGTVIDRFGTPAGRVFSAAETPFARRSLPPDLLEAGYRRYRVTRALPAWRTVSAPWFGQSGGGERYRTTYSALELVALGYLADITGGAE
ncbi:MAG TPA: TNT domain-containing protein [Actinophytocola sp.]|uniref:TNT domain-containing protein n=1 Tax=Actinophytocola sp. TaxID=1872138 RepID=UPI002DBC1757|nr:TNT domain-containing protein [Actinophytocola sp.]HEU5475808.1 TNT domain-containing protein [Actinophytocola sp.]